MNIQRTLRWDGETTLVSQLASAASLLSLLFYFRHGDLLLYGDAVAHINIARRVIDSRTPGLLQLGTVWLPLPHLLMIPFLFSDAAWRTGIAGAVPSMCAYVLGAVGIFRLVREGLSGAQTLPTGTPALRARIPAWLAAALYAANPNLLYLQTTAMTEVVYLAFFIWSVVHFSEFVQSANQENGDESYSSLRKCGWCVVAACLTRYDGWFLAGALCLGALCVSLKSKPSLPRFGLMKFILLAVAAPALWLGYNAIIYRNPLEFANGPYSARAIEQQKTALSHSSPHPGWHNLHVSFSYFLKAAEDNVAGKLQKAWVAILLAGFAIIIVFSRRAWPLLLLAVPIAFYTLSIAYGSVPIYLPNWWPFSRYNVRFGLELLPAFAAMTAVTFHFLFGYMRQRAQRVAIVLIALALVATNYVVVWRAQPICYQEAWTNSRSRIVLETALARTLLKLPPDSTLLMYLGEHSGALQDAGIPLRHTINEGNHRPWRRPSDPEGLWERALADPRKYADYVIAIDDDPVAAQVQRRDLTSMVVIRTIGQPPATVYWTHRLER